jgi:arsenite-transporting ATPase
VVGLQRLQDLSKVLYAEGEDPSEVTRVERPYRFEKIDGRYEIHLTLPFATKAEIGLFKKADELVVEVGTLRRHIGLPTSMATLSPGRARLMDKTLVIEMKETQ